MKPQNPNSQKIHVLIGVISINGSALARLLHSAKTVQSDAIRLDFFVFANHPNFQKPSVGLAQSTLTYLPLEADNCLDIAQARNVLQRAIYHHCQQITPPPFVWLLDEDLIIDASAREYLPRLLRLKARGIDVAIGSIEGDSPNSAFAGMQVQLFDLVANLTWLNALDGTSVLPNRASLNQQLRAQYPDYYYDFSSRHRGHLTHNFWLTPAFLGETVASAKATLYANLDAILAGKNVFRALVKPTITEPEDTLLRGGNTFILNLDTLKIQHPIIRINNITARRSDMLWALINKTVAYKKIVKVDFVVAHNRQNSTKNELSLRKTLKEIYGSTIFNALKIFYDESQSLDFKDILSHQIATRIAMMTQSIAQTKIYIAELEKMNEPKLQQFCQTLRDFYQPKNTDLIVQKTQQLTDYADEILAQFNAQQPVINNQCVLENIHGTFQQYDLGDDHIKLFSKQPIELMSKTRPPLVRIHAACSNSEAFGATDCDCASQLNQAFKIIHRAGDGIIFYLNQEGRGHGYGKKIAIINKMQTEAIDTYESCRRLDFALDSRNYADVAMLLKTFGFTKIRLLSNNPAKRENLLKYGIEAANEPIKGKCTPNNSAYLVSKQTQANHHILALDADFLSKFAQQFSQNEAIYFRNKTLGYFELSNFSDDPFSREGIYWRTVEHYYQANKFYEHPKIYQQIQQAKTPDLAKNIADFHPDKIHRNWRQYRVPCMYQAVQAKFSQNSSLRKMLLKTQHKYLIERADEDAFWGDGADGHGSNILGKLLMYLRDELQRR